MVLRSACRPQPADGPWGLKRPLGNASGGHQAVHLNLTVLGVTIGAPQACRHDYQRHVPTEKLRQGLRVGSSGVFAGPATDDQGISDAPIGQLGGLRWAVHVKTLPVNAAAVQPVRKEYRCCMESIGAARRHPWCDRCGHDHAGVGCGIGQQVVDESLQVRDVGYLCLRNEAIITGNTVAGGDLRDRGQ